MPRGKKYELNKLDETLAALSQVTTKPKSTINLKEIIRKLKPQIKRLRGCDYSWGEIRQLLKQQGIELAENTLKDYLKTPRRSNKKPQSPAKLVTAQRETGKGMTAEKKDDKLLQVQNENRQQNQTEPPKKPEERIAKSLVPKPVTSEYTPIKLRMKS